MLESRRLLAANLVISEFMASNSNGIVDSFGDHSDWLEIHNAGDASANLNDYFLTDNASDPEEWRFPSESLAAGGYQVVFASGRDLAVAGQELHTNFKLSADGEYLGLIRASDDTPQFEYAPTFPAQTSDISYGLFNADDPNMPVSSSRFRPPAPRTRRPRRRRLILLPARHSPARCPLLCRARLPARASITPSTARCRRLLPRCIPARFR